MWTAEKLRIKNQRKFEKSELWKVMSGKRKVQKGKKREALKIVKIKK